MTDQRAGNSLLCLVAGVIIAIGQSPLSHAAVVSKWSLDEAGAAANTVAGAPAGKVERALPADGRDGKALAFLDWSVVNYLKPDPSQATRVVIPHDPKLLPALPFRISTWIFPTADPVYYGGIVEKGQGFGAAYRLVLLRGLKLQATLGDQNIKVIGSAPISLNQWHEVTLVANATSLALIVDGKEVGKSPVPAGLTLSSTDPVLLGSRFTGRIDEVSISSD